MDAPGGPPPAAAGKAAAYSMPKAEADAKVMLALAKVVLAFGAGGMVPGARPGNCCPPPCLCCCPPCGSGCCRY